MDPRQIEPWGLRPVVDVQIFGVRADLLKHCSLPFDEGHDLLTLIFFLALQLQAVGAPYAFQGAVTERERSRESGGGPRRREVAGAARRLAISSRAKFGAPGDQEPGSVRPDPRGRAAESDVAICGPWGRWWRTDAL